MPRVREPVSVAQVITAPRLRIFELLATPDRHREIDGSAMLQTGVVYGPPRLHLGAVFTVPMRQSIMRYRSTNEVVEFTEGFTLAWQTFGKVAGHTVIGGQVWSWELSEAGAGATLVRHTYDWQRARRPLLLTAGRYPARMAEAMQTSLQRLEQAVTRH